MESESITPLKTRQNQRRTPSEGHTHSQRRTPSLQDKPIPDLTPPPAQRSPAEGIAPIKPRQASFGSPLAPRFRDGSTGLDDSFTQDSSDGTGNGSLQDPPKEEHLQSPENLQDSERSQVPPSPHK